MWLLPLPGYVPTSALLKWRGAEGGTPCQLLPEATVSVGLMDGPPPNAWHGNQGLGSLQLYKFITGWFDLKV